MISVLVAWPFVQLLWIFAGADTLTPYMTLSLAHREIRLISLNPSLDNGMVKCSLTTVSLDTNPMFEALSYAWGNPNVTRPILLNGQEFEVTTNLESALQHLRYSNSVRVLWIDALCINQKNIAERNHQVRLMRDVYKTASSCVIWIGAASYDSHFALELLSLISSGDDLHLDRRTDPYLDQRYLSKRYIAAVISFVERDWWHRVWTVQETVLPKDLMFVCGNASIAGDKIFLAAARVIRHSVSCCRDWYLADDPPGLTSLAKALEPVFSLDQAREKVSQNQHNIFFNFLANFQARLCSDPRDRIYGYLGLTSGSLLNFILPDYSLSVEEVLEEAALKTIQNLNSLWMFSFLEGNLNNHLQVASWIPTWTTLDDGDIHRAQTFRRSQLWLYSASRKRSPKVVRVHPGIISLEGIAVDSLVTIGQVQHFEGAREHLDVYQKWTSLAVKPNSPYVDSDTKQFDAFWMTLCNGIVGNWDELNEINNPILVSHDVPKYRLIYNKWWSWKASGKPGDVDTANFEQAVIGSTRNRALFLSNKGYMGLGPMGIQRDDIVVVLYGGRVPYVLRPTREYLEVEYGSVEPTYRILGTAYVHGIMDGEAVEAARVGKLAEQSFVLV